MFTPPASSAVNNTTEEILDCKIAVDCVVVTDSSMVVTGWIARNSTISFLDFFGYSAEPATMHFYDRKDVPEAYQVPNEDVGGFVAIWPNRPLGESFTITITGSTEIVLVVKIPSISPIEDFIKIAADNVKRLGTLIRTLSTCRNWMAAILPFVADPPPFFGGARGHIDYARGISGVGGLVVGWTVDIPPCETIIISSSGVACSASEAMRWNRDDIIQAFDHEYGTFTFDAGFLAGLHGGIGIHSPVCLVALDGERAYVIARSEWAAAPTEPTSFAKWAFDFPLPKDRFGAQLKRHISPIVEELIRRKNIGVNRIAPIVTQFGDQVAHPICSIIVPLFGRHNFMQQQLLEFVDDPFIRSKTELLYVIDDPRIRSQVLTAAAVYSEVYGIPFQVIDGRVNRGYSAANNLGASISRSPTLLFLNSDVFPTSPGWLQKMLKPLAADLNVGIVGARLVFGNGYVQHDGMMFEWDITTSAYLNRHPGAGLAPSRASEIPGDRIAVTGACLLIDASLYRNVGMFDEEFLIGDFEDSDLCLKVRQAGRRIVCVEDVALVHLERQSFSRLGTSTFRQGIVYYNLYRHQSKWAATIESILAEAQFKGSR